MKAQSFLVRHRDSLLLALIFMLGLALRLYKLGFQSFWLDEYYNILLAKTNWVIGPTTDIPPVYSLILGAWLRIFPLSEITARIPGAVLGSFSILVMYLFVKDLFDKRTAILSSFFFSISAIHIDYSQEAKYYSLTILMTMLMMWTYNSAIKNLRLKTFFLYLSAVVSGLYTHYYLVSILFVQFMHNIVLSHATKGSKKKILAVQAASFLLFLPWILPILFNPRWARGTLAWLGKPSPFSLVYTSVSLIAGKYWQYIQIFNIGKSLRFFVYSIFFFILIIALILLRSRMRKNSNILLMFLYFLIPTVSLYVFSILVFPVYHIRYVIATMLGLFVVLSWVILNSKYKSFSAILILLFVLINILSLAHYFSYPVRTQYRESAQYLKNSVGPSENIVLQGYVNQCRLEQYYLEKFGGNTQIKCLDHKDNLDIDRHDWFVFTWKDRDSVDKRLCLQKEFLGLDIYRRCY